VHTRAARPDDLHVLQGIERTAGQLFRDAGMVDVAEDPPPSLNTLTGYLLADRAWVACDSTDLPAAYLIADLIDGNLHIEQVSVHPRYARQRIGQRLIETLAQQGLAAGVPALTLTTFADVAWNAPYYRRYGFTVIDDNALSPGLRSIREREAAQGLDRWPRVCMRRDL